jgi:hypothetical protein
MIANAQAPRLPTAAHAEGTGAAEPLLELPRDRFPELFDRQPFLVRHKLSDHPLFQLPRLVELAKSLPPEFIEYYRGDVSINMDWEKTPRNGLSVEETIWRIENCGSWMVLKRVDQDPQYREILGRCCDIIQPLSEPLAPGMRERAGAIFISSPNSVTPYHIDHEYNFLLQIYGQKTIHIFDASDRSLVSEEALEKYYTKGSLDRNLEFREEFQQKAHTVVMEPGDGVHVPSTAPHWVKNGPRVSISFSVGFYTSVSDQRGLAHRFNRFLRKLGIPPVPVGQSLLRDRMKGFVYRGAVAAGRTLRQLKSLPTE